jgi:spore coat protein U-like protein
VNPSGPLMRSRGGAMRLCALFACMASAPLAYAADTCFVSATPVAFGVYDTVASSPTPGSGQITVDCQGNKEVPVAIALSAGNGSYAARRMTSPLDALQYNLYLDTGYTRVFGDGSAGTVVASCMTGVTAGGCTGSNPTGTFKRIVLPFFGRIPALQNVASGDYSDSIQVTITF